MVHLRWADRTAQDYAELVRLVPDAALASPRRSTVPLLDMCRDPQAIVAQLGRIAGYALRDPVKLSFEHEVPVQKGRGKPSCTDLMVLGSDAAIAVEAKYTEPAYESVGEWLGAARDTNRGQVLDGWLGVLERTAGRKIPAADVTDLPYQLVHRCASAAIVDRPKKALAYLVFGSDVAAHYRTHLAQLHEILGGRAELPFLLIRCAMEPSASMQELTERWNAGERSLGKDVREALLCGPLFAFGALETLYGSAQQIRL